MPNWLTIIGEQTANATRSRQELAWLKEFHDARDELAGDRDMDGKSKIVREALGAPLKTESPYWRLQQCWCVVRSHRGESVGDAQKSFKAYIWPLLKSVPATNEAAALQLLDWVQAAIVELEVSIVAGVDARGRRSFRQTESGGQDALGECSDVQLDSLAESIDCGGDEKDNLYGAFEEDDGGQDALGECSDVQLYSLAESIDCDGDEKDSLY